MNVRDVDGKSVLDRLIAKMPDAAMVIIITVKGTLDLGVLILRTTNRHSATRIYVCTH